MLIFHACHWIAKFTVNSFRFHKSCIIMLSKEASLATETPVMQVLKLVCPIPDDRQFDTVAVEIWVYVCILLW